MEFFREIISYLSPGGTFESFLLAITLSATRIYAIIRLLPPLGGRIVPPALRIVLSIVLAYSMAGMIDIESFPTAPAVAFLILKEALIGFVIGFVASLPFYFMQQSGYLMDVSRGGAMSQMLSPTGEDAASPFSNMFFFLCILFFFASPAGTSFWMGLKGTFTAVPLYPLDAPLPAAGGMVDVCMATVAKLFLSSVMLALPVMLLVLIVDILTGTLGRFSPYTGGYFISMPLRSAAGICGVMLALVFISPVIEGMLMNAMDAINGLFGI